MLITAVLYTWDQLQSGICRNQCRTPTREREAYDDGAWDRRRSSCYCIDFEKQRQPKAKAPLRLTPPPRRNVDPDQRYD